MECVSKYKGKTFNTETDLLDFLSQEFPDLDRESVYQDGILYMDILMIL